MKKELGIADRSCKERIVRSLVDHGALDNALRHGRACKYTADHFHAAHDLLKAGGSLFYIGADLVAYLVECGELPEDAAPAGFMPALKRYLKTHRWSLGYGPRCITFALGEAHKLGRLAWSLEQRLLITSSSVEELAFEDESRIDEGGKPKGGCMPAGPFAVPWKHIRLHPQQCVDGSRCPLRAKPPVCLQCLAAVLPVICCHYTACMPNPNLNRARPACAMPCPSLAVPQILPYTTRNSARISSWLLQRGSAASPTCTSAARPQGPTRDSLPKRIVQAPPWRSLGGGGTNRWWSLFRTRQAWVAVGRAASELQAQR